MHAALFGCRRLPCIVHWLRDDCLLLTVFSLFFFQEIVDAVLAIQEEGKTVDLFMVETMSMLHKTETDTK